MGTVFSSGMIPLLPDPSAPVSAAEDLGYPFQIPKVFLDGASESYYPQMNFSRSDDAVVMLREHSLVTYTRSAFAELLVELPVRHIVSGKQIFDRELNRQGESTICTLAPIEKNTGFAF